MHSYSELQGAIAARPAGQRGRWSAFTLIEMIVVTAVLLLMAALITPNALKFRDSQIARDSVPAAQRLLNYAHDAAIANKTTVVVTCEQSSNQLMVKQDSTVDQNAPTQSINSSSQNASQVTVSGSSSGQQINVPYVPVVDPNKLVIDKTVTLPKNLQIGHMQVNGTDVDSGDFQLRFYSDGRCDGGGIAFTMGSTTQSLVIDDQGKVTFVDGDLPDPTTIRWEAGQFEPRQGA